MKSSKRQHQVMALTELGNILKATKQDTLYTVLRKVSSSGMQREISVILIDADRLSHLDWLVSESLAYKQGKDGIVIRGCGMDMGFALVDSINKQFGTNFRQQWV